MTHIDYDLHTDAALAAAVESGRISTAEGFLRLALACCDQGDVSPADQAKIAAIVGIPPFNPPTESEDAITRDRAERDAIAADLNEILAVSHKRPDLAVRRLVHLFANVAPGFAGDGDAVWTEA